MSQQDALQVDLRQMVIAIETAVSLVGMNDTNHGKRVGFIATQIGRQLGLDSEQLHYVFELGMLHDCGVSTEQMHADLVNYFDWNHADLHCEIGYTLLKDFPPLAKFATPIRYHHTHWETLRDAAISAADARMANLIFLADRVDVRGAPHYHSDILIARAEIVDRIHAGSGSLFDPELVAAFSAVQESEALWISLEDRHITRYTWDMGKQQRTQALSLDELQQLSLILSYIVDQKSPFTAQHSVRVADVAKFLSRMQGLTAAQCIKVEVAALLHDLGKLHMPDHILEKPGPLDPIERSIMDQHSYETYEILRHIDGLGDIARWAAYHHEGLNGAGYPFHPTERDISIEARIIAVADVFQALVQDRPYRSGMSIHQVFDILDQQVADNKLDPKVVRLTHQYATDCYAIARGHHTECNPAYSALVERAADAAAALRPVVNA